MLRFLMRCLVYISLFLGASCATPYRHLRPASEGIQAVPDKTVPDKTWPEQTTHGQTQQTAPTQGENRRTGNRQTVQVQRDQKRPLQTVPAQDAYRQAALAIARPDFERALYHCAVEGRAAWKRYRFSGLLFFRKTADSAIHVVFQSQAGLSYFNFRWARDGRFEVVQLLDALNKQAIIKTLRKDFEILLGMYLQGGVRWLESPADQKVLDVNGVEDRLLYFFEAKELSRIERIELWAKRRKVLDFKASNFLPGALPEAVNIRHLRAGFTIELKKINTAPEQQ